MSDPAGTDSVLGADPLDSRVARRPLAAGRRESSLRRRLAAGLSATPVPGLLLAVGLALGPEGLNLLSRGVLSYLDPAVTAALAALGLLVGLGVDWRRGRELRLLGAASLEATLTMLLVGVGVLLLSLREPDLVPSGWALALIVGICASASSTSPAADPALLGSAASRISDLDDVLPILAGGAALAAFRARSPFPALGLTLECLALAVAAACAAWLLLSRCSSESEQHVFTAGVVLLLGGLAEFLGMSALFFGLVAGAVLRVLGGSVRERIARDLRHVQHPLLVLLLLVAGARVAFAPALLALVLVYVPLRLAGKLGAGALLRRMAPARAAWDLGRSLVSPGVIAAAFALNLGQAGADPAGLVLAVAVSGSVFSELLALLVRRREPS